MEIIKFGRYNRLQKSGLHLFVKQSGLFPSNLVKKEYHEFLNSFGNCKLRMDVMIQIFFFFTYCYLVYM